MAIRGTTPVYSVEVFDYDLTDKTVYVTIAQGNRKLTLAGDRLTIGAGADGSTIVFRLSQDETLAMKEGSADVQVKTIDSGGHVDGTGMGTITFEKALLDKVIAYADD